jgi:hypothetical protein
LLYGGPDALANSLLSRRTTILPAICTGDIPPLRFLLVKDRREAQGSFQVRFGLSLGRLIERHI